MSITVTPSGAALGAEISGVDLSSPLGADEVAVIRAAFRDHLVLAFRGQTMGETDQIRFCRYLGETERYRLRPSPLSEHPDEVMIVSNLKEGETPLGTLPDGALELHADGLWADIPPKATSLYAIEVPARAGETYFANLYTAYDQLPADLKAAFDRATAIHEYNFGGQYQGDATSHFDPIRHAHPAVVRHPDTGKRIIFVNRLMTHSLQGLPDGESTALLERVYRHCANPEFIHAHHWRPGDFVIWDNWATLHGRKDFDPGERRLLKRVTIKGESRPHG